jgi:hypothetical protein
MEKPVQYSGKLIATVERHKASKTLPIGDDFMKATATCRAKITYEETFSDEKGIHITGDKDEWLLPPNVQKEDFEKVIIEDLKGEEVNSKRDREMLLESSEQKINGDEYEALNNYLKKFISLGVFVLSVFFAIWLNNSLKNVIGVFATLLAGLIIILSSISSIFLMFLSTSQLRNNLN